MRSTASFILAAGLAPSCVVANCFSQMTGGDGPYSQLLDSNPKSAIAPILSELATPRTLSTAHLYAMLMDAYDDSGEIGKAVEASHRGIAAWRPADGEGLRRRLQLTGILLLDELGQIDKAANDFEAASALVPADAPDMICVLLDRAHLRKRAGRKVDATTDSMRAFRLAQDLGEDDLRIEAGLRLAAIYSAYLKHAAEPFFSTKQVGSGAGLGLSMVEGFVTQSGGSMAIASEVDRGTTVTLWMPVKDPKA